MSVLEEFTTCVRSKGNLSANETVPYLASPDPWSLALTAPRASSIAGNLLFQMPSHAVIFMSWFTVRRNMMLLDTRFFSSGRPPSINRFTVQEMQILLLPGAHTMAHLG